MICICYTYMIYKICTSVHFLFCSSGTANLDWVYYALISIPILFTVVGLIYMIRKICFPKMQECCVDIEKEDVNNEYEYDINGDMRENVMEVTFYHSLESQSTFPTRTKFLRSKIGIQHMKPPTTQPVILARLMTMTTWETKTYVLAFLCAF